jgi:hypothetical protein
MNISRGLNILAQESHSNEKTRRRCTNMAINIKTDTKNLKKTDFSTVKKFGKNNKVYIALQSVNLGVNIGKKRVFFSYFSHFFESIHGLQNRVWVWTV